MFLLYGVVALGISFLWFSLALICFRNPKTRWYGSEFMQAYIWTPFSAAGLALGLLLARKSFPEFPPSVLEMLLVLAAIAAATVLYRLMNVKQRLLPYKKEEEKAEAATDFLQTDSPVDPGAPPAATPVLISPELRKSGLGITPVLRLWKCARRRADSVNLPGPKIEFVPGFGWRRRKCIDLAYRR